MNNFFDYDCMLKIKTYFANNIDSLKFLQWSLIIIVISLTDVHYYNTFFLQVHNINNVCLRRRVNNCILDFKRCI